MSRLVSDDRLAHRAKDGDPRAFEAIYRRYHQDLYRFCLAMLGNPADAQEALQDTMVKVLRGLPGETRHIHLKPWLYRIARNESIETIRRRRDNVEIDAEQLVSTSRVSDTAEARERLRKLIADFKELPERQRAALVMRELAGLGFAEIAEAFETSAAVARQTVYEARLSLRQMEEGREMGCAEVTRELSDGDGRITRRRGVRAHLRSCPNCRAFDESIAIRHRDLAAIAPLPLAVSAGLLHGVLTGQANAAVGASAAGLGGAAGGGVGGGAGGLAGTVGAGAGKVVATSAIVKSVATIAVVAAVGVSAADRTGLIHVGLPGSGPAATTSSSPPNGAQPAAIGAPATAGSVPSSPAETGRGPSVDPAAAARLVESMKNAGQHGQAAARAHTTATSAGQPEQGVRPGSQASGHKDAAAARSHGQRAASAHSANRKHAKPKAHSKRHSHSNPPVHHAVPHAGSGHSQPANPAGTHRAPTTQPSRPSSTPTQPTPAQPTTTEGEATLPEP